MELNDDLLIIIVLLVELAMTIVGKIKYLCQIVTFISLVT